MKLISRVFLSLSLLSILVLPIHASVASAVDVGTGVCDRVDENGDPDVDARPDICDDIEPASKARAVNPLFGPKGIITRTVNGLSLVAGVVAVLMIIIAGIKMSLSSGDSGAVKSARDQIVYAAVGLVVAVLAQAIVRFVLNRIGV